MKYEYYLLPLNEREHFIFDAQRASNIIAMVEIIYTFINQGPFLDFNEMKDRSF